MSSLSIQEVYKTYGQSEVLKGIDIAVEAGEFLVLVGPSGCGKSTLLNMIAGLEAVSGGDILMGEERVNDKHPSERDIAMVFQSYALYPNMTVAQNIAFGLEMRGVPKAEREQAINQVATMLQIDHLLKRRPGALSGGQRQRVAMGRALVRSPKIFLFDEPLSNLDAKLRVDMRTEIKRLHQRLGTTIVYVTHDQIEAMTMATTIAVMKDGIVQQLGSPETIYNQPANTFVAGFMGSPSMNLLPVTLHKQDGHWLAHLGDERGEQTLSLVQSLPDSRDGRPAVLGLRPETITDPLSAKANSTPSQPLHGKVEVAEPTGADVFAVTELAGVSVTARLRAGVAVPVGERFEFAVDMHKAVLFDPDSGVNLMQEEQ